MDKQLKIKDASAVDYGIQSYNSSSKLMDQSQVQHAQLNSNKNRLFSAGHTISHQTVHKYVNKSKMDISNNDESHDILQSRTKLTTNDRYNLNSGPNGQVEKRPITANPTAN